LKKRKPSLKMSSPQKHKRDGCALDTLLNKFSSIVNGVIIGFDRIVTKKFKVHRHTEGQDKSEPKKLQPMRKGIADINVRAEVSRNIVDRFTNHMAAMEDKTQLGELLDSISKSFTVDGKKIRALDAFGKDHELLRAISDPIFDVSALTNKDLQEKLKGTAWAKGMGSKRLSGRISRHLLLLRKHGLIKKLPNQRKYALTEKGRLITAAVNAALAASVNDLLKLAA